MRPAPPLPRRSRRHRLAQAALLLALVGAVVLCSRPCLAAAQQPLEPAEPGTVTEETTTAARAAEEAFGEFSSYVNSQLEDATENAAFGWLLMMGLALGGVVSLVYGWGLTKSLLVPFAPVLGLAAGGVIAFCIIELFFTEQPPWLRLLMLAGGALVGLGGYLFTALRAQPLAVFLVILAPFLIIAAFLFPQGGPSGLVVFGVGILAAFAGMVQVRPLAIVSTSIFGAACLLGAYGTLANLLDERSSLRFVQESFNWLLERPGLLAVVALAISVLGANFQFTTGPRGTLED